jgi:hypothetical protein
MHVFLFLFFIFRKDKKQKHASDLSDDGEHVAEQALMLCARAPQLCERLPLFFFLQALSEDEEDVAFFFLRTMRNSCK